MGEFFREVGFKAAGVLPLTLGIVGLVLGLAAWGAIWAYGHKAKGQLWFCSAVLVVTLALLPWSFFTAKEYCSDLASLSQTSTRELGEFSTPITYNSAYADSKCGSVWPNGSG